MFSKSFVIAAAALGAAAASAAAAQSDGEATLYGRGHFQGPGTALSGPARGIGPMTVKSLQIAPGSAWELCTGSTFTGCTRFNQSKPGMVMTVRSARPVAPPIPATATVAGTTSPAGVKGTGASLRGLASEFFVMPDEGGNRIAVADTAAGALPRRATEFCRAHGWRTSVYQRVQAVGGATYLADVLCANDDR